MKNGIKEELLNQLDAVNQEKFKVATINFISNSQGVRYGELCNEESKIKAQIKKLEEE